MMMISREQHRRIRAVFDAMDTERDGRLSVAELRWGLRELGVKCSSAQLAALVERIDANHDEEISYEEFAAFLGQLPSVNAVAVFELFQEEVQYDDANGEYTPASRAHEWTRTRAATKRRKGASHGGSSGTDSSGSGSGSGGGSGSDRSRASTTAIDENLAPLSKRLHVVMDVEKR